MSEIMFASAYQQLAENLLAIKKSGDWQRQAVSFEVYVQQRWSLSKTRAKQLLDFAKFCSMAREEYLRPPDSPDNIKPLLSLPQKHWMNAWLLCLDYADGKSINASHCQATMDHFGIISRKRIPQKVLNSKRVQKATETLASFGSGDKLTDQVGVNGLGKHWDTAVRVTIEADQAAMSERGRLR